MKNVADEIGTLRAAIASLKADLEILEDAAKHNGPTTMDGEMYRVVVSKFDKTTVPWKAVAVALGTPAQVKRVSKRMSKKTPVTKLTCSALLTSKAA